MNALERIRIAIVEDMADVREGLRYYLNMEKQFRVLGFYDAAEKLLEDLEKGLVVDVVLLDIDLPGMNGIEAIPIIRKACPKASILMLSIFEDKSRIMKSIRAGAGGYILKNTKPQDLIEQVHSIHNGGSPISPSIARTILTEIQTEPHSEEQNDYGLSPREKQILEDIIDGLTYKDIAVKYEIAVSTSKTHILHIYQKLNVSSKVEIVKKAIREKLI